MRWIAWLLASACASGPSVPERSPAARVGHSASPPAQIALGEQECEELVTHAVALGIDERAAAHAPQTTPSDHEATRRALAGEFVTGCRALPRAAYRCAMAATTLAQLAACQRTPSSSTSNSSVAPGGITPPAPRSP